MTTEQQPAHEPTVSISLTVKNAGQALDFYTKALGARELFRMNTPDGSVGHAEFMIGDTRLFISGESEDWKAFAMPEGETASCLFGVMVEDCESSFEQAIEAGSQSVSGPQDYFWGMRTGVIRDPYGYRWSISQRVEDVAPEEIERRAKAMFEQGQCPPQEG